MMKAAVIATTAIKLYSIIKNVLTKIAACVSAQNDENDIIAGNEPIAASKVILMDDKNNKSHEFASTGRITISIEGDVNIVNNNNYYDRDEMMTTQAIGEI